MTSLCASTITCQIHDRVAEARACADLGNTYRALSELSKAAEYYEMTLALAQELGRRADEAVAFCNLGTVYQACR